MEQSSLIKNIAYGEDKPTVQQLLETENTKEIRITMKQGQVMKEHKTPFPIVVEVFEGEIEFSVAKDPYLLLKGDLVALDGNVPHDLKANANSIIRLSLSKADNVKRVENVVN